MKLRIKGNSIRLRLTKSDVHKLVTTGNVIETTQIGKDRFQYELQTSNQDKLQASLHDNTITVYIPKTFVIGWDVNEVIGIDNESSITAGNSLFILVEKDFACLDETVEDQSDNYENPNQVC